MDYIKKDLLINICKTTKVYKVKTRSILLLFTCSFSVIGYGADDSTNMQVNTTLKASSADNGQIVCKGDMNNKKTCYQHKNQAKTHANQAKKLAKIADKQQAHAEQLHVKVKSLTYSNPKAANDLGAVASQAQTSAKLTAAAAHAHASAAVAHTKAAKVTSDNSSLSDCSLSNHQDKASCQHLNKTQKAHQQVSHMLNKSIKTQGKGSGSSITPSAVIQHNTSADMATNTAHVLTQQAQKQADVVVTKVKDTQQKQKMDDTQKNNNGSQSSQPKYGW